MEKINNLHIILITILILSLTISLIILSSNKNAIQLVNEMGIGYNLGNIFDCYNKTEKVKNPDDQINLCGNEAPTLQMIKNIKKYGFRTIRLPVTWINFIDELGNINSEWMSRIKEVVDWIIDLNMYCILNVYHDGDTGNWLSEGLKSKNKYINLWKQLAEEFKKYDEHLIFESMSISENDNYDIILALNQAFVDTIRNSEMNNKKRLLLICFPYKDMAVDLSYLEEYKIPNDPYNKLALSIKYYYPPLFNINSEDNPRTIINQDGNIINLGFLNKWGSENNYKEMINNFEIVKNSYINNGIPVIFVEVGVLTKKNKEIESIREYLYAFFSLSNDYNGIMSCLWDTSNKLYGDFNYYDRENNEWYDEIIKQNFRKLSKGKYIKITDYFINTNLETIFNENNEDYILMIIGTEKFVKIIYNIKLGHSTSFKEMKLSYALITHDTTGKSVVHFITNAKIKKEYDGSYTFTVDSIKGEYKEIIRIQQMIPMDMSFTYLTIELEEYYKSLDYNSYKFALSNS